MSAPTENPITPFLEQNKALVLDGGLATELEMRGYDLDDSLWSARFLLEDPAAIRQVHGGGNYIEPRIAQQLALSLLPGNDKNPVDRLSRREFQVMLMISQGLSNNEISDKLCLSPKTVSTYRARLLEKLGAHNEVDLIKIAVEQGMVEFAQSEQEPAA